MMAKPAKSRGPFLPVKPRVDEVWIRDVREWKLDERYRFKSAAEAVEAMGEIQRICKANP